MYIAIQIYNNYNNYNYMEMGKIYIYNDILIDIYL